MMGVLILIFLLLPFSAFPCSSDCYQCHINIPKDENHTVLKTCTQCHSEHDEKPLESGCGADCFECHDYKKVLSLSPAHKVIQKCVKCHKGLENSEILNKLIGGGSLEGNVKGNY